jgi:hypothetical protein
VFGGWERAEDNDVFAVGGVVMWSVVVFFHTAKHPLLSEQKVVDSTEKQSAQTKYYMKRWGVKKTNTVAQPLRERFQTLKTVVTTRRFFKYPDAQNPNPHAPHENKKMQICGKKSPCHIFCARNFQRVFGVILVSLTNFLGKKK